MLLFYNIYYTVISCTRFKYRPLCIVFACGIQNLWINWLIPHQVNTVFLHCIIFFSVIYENLRCFWSFIIPSSLGGQLRERCCQSWRSAWSHIMSSSSCWLPLQELKSTQVDICLLHPCPSWGKVCICYNIKDVTDHTSDVSSTALLIAQV